MGAIGSFLVALLSLGVGAKAGARLLCRPRELGQGSSQRRVRPAQEVPPEAAGSSAHSRVPPSFYSSAQCVWQSCACAGEGCGGSVHVQVIVGGWESLALVGVCVCGKGQYRQTVPLVQKCLSPGV